MQRMTHLYLWVGALVLVLCGAVWVTHNPLVNLLASMQTTMDVNDGFNIEEAYSIVKCSRNIGMGIFSILSSFLIMLSFVMLCHVQGCDSSKEENRHDHANGESCLVSERRSSWTSRQWHHLVAFMLCESTSAVAFLGFCFWRNAHGDFDLLGGSSYTGGTTAAVFSIRLLLTWIAPFLLVAHVVPVVILATCSFGWEPRVAAATRPFALGTVLTHSSIELILSIVYYRSGYGNVVVLHIAFIGLGLNILSFVILSVSDETSGNNECNSCLVSFAIGATRFFFGFLQVAGCLALAHHLGDTGSWPFLVSSLITSAYLAWAATKVFLEIAKDTCSYDPLPICGDSSLLAIEGGSTPTADTIKDSPSKSRTVGTDGLNSPAFIAWSWETKEAADKERYGARIKGRRLCLLIGAASLLISARNVYEHNTQFGAWEDVNVLVEKVAGSGAMIARDQTSVFEPLVERYGKARQQHLMCSVTGAGLFATAALLDIFGSGSARMLKACRLCGLFATMAYVMGMLVENAPDYVGMLDFGPTLGRCGANFCQAVATSVRAGLGAAFLAQSGVTFLPVLLSLPWTLGRIAFFLAADAANTRAVTALTWGTLTCILRLSILPATVAFVYRPIALVAWLYLLFLVAPSLFLLWVVATKRTGLVWYFLWGWIFFFAAFVSHGFGGYGRGYVATRMPPLQRAILEGKLANHSC